MLTEAQQKVIDRMEPGVWYNFRQLNTGYQLLRALNKKGLLTRRIEIQAGGTGMTDVGGAHYFRLKSGNSKKSK